MENFGIIIQMDIVIIRLMLSDLLWPKVITMSGAYCIISFRELKKVLVPIDQGFPTFWLLRPPKHQLRPPTGVIVPKRPLLRHLLRPPRGTRPPGWEPLL
jgi:hypothetical protein